MTRNKQITARQVPIAVALLALFGMSVGALATISLNPKMLPFVPFFPAGLSFLFIPAVDAVRGLNQGFASILTVVAMAGSYVIYVGLFAIIVRARRWSGFTTACLILACVLVLNVVGCRAMLQEWSKVQ